MEKGTSPTMRLLELRFDLASQPHAVRPSTIRFLPS